MDADRQGGSADEATGAGAMNQHGEATEQTVPVDQTVPIGQTVPAAQTVPMGQTMPMDQTVPAAQPARPQPAGPRGPYAPSIISGVLMVAAAVLIGLAQLSDIEVDYGLLLPVGMVVTGVLLVVGALVAVLRGR